MFLKGSIAPWVLGLSIGMLTGCCSDKAPSGPTLDRVENWFQNPEYTVGDGDTILNWMNTKAPAVTVSNPESQWPNGLAASMTPFLVDWENSAWSVADSTITSNSYALVSNVYVAGNPILGKTRLATIRIPAQGIKTVEFIVVRYALKGLAKTKGHVQLRFVFHENRRPELLNPDGTLNQDNPYLDDLILSWEAWRPTMDSWEFKTGLNTENYLLTARMYAGNQRFLQDSLRGAVWDCYPLDLSAHESVADMILLSGVLLGDGVGRELIWGMLEEGLITDPTDMVKRNWKDEDKLRARKMFAWEGMPNHPIKPYLKDVDAGYHALQSSCINATLKQIDVAMDWVYENNDLGARKKINVAPVEIPKWFDDIATGNRWGKIYRAPHGIIWLMSHKEVLPYKSYRALEDADLLQSDKKGRTIFYRYGHQEVSPYGPLKERIM